jgi:hypothetical protein
MYEEGLSLGWDCHSAITGVRIGLRKTKLQGYKTCPFDIMITNYKGIIDCIKDDFEYLCDTNYLDLIKIPKESKLLNTNGEGDDIIYNNKYKFFFNHESPGHAYLYASEKWKNGINHYILNNYEELIKRYKKRIANFKELINSGKKITFILTRPIVEGNEINELRDVISNKYPFLTFNFLLLDYDKYKYYDGLILMNVDKNDEEIKRLCI